VKLPHVGTPVAGQQEVNYNFLGHKISSRGRDLTTCNT
jgi:hypothetical protein